MTEDLQAIYDFGPNESQGLEVGVQGFGIFPMFHTNGKILMVPKNYSFPQGMKRREGWDLWLKGDERKKVRPYRLLQAKYLPKPMAQSFKRNWKPIFQEMEKAEDIELPQDTRTMTSDDIEVAYEVATAHLQEKYSFLFSGKRKYETWTISTWSTNISVCNVIKHGTESDKAKVGELSWVNCKHSAGRQKKKWEKRKIGLNNKEKNGNQQDQQEEEKERE